MFWKKAICPYKKENCSLKLTVHQLENKVEELEKEIISLQIPKPYMLFNEYWVYCLCKQLTTKEKKEWSKNDISRMYYVNSITCKLIDKFSTYWEVKAYLKWMWVLLSN